MSLKQGNESFDIPYDLARVSAIQGNTAEGCAWLQKAIDAGWRFYSLGEVDPLLENLRGDERYKRMMVDVKSKVEEMRKRIEGAEKKEASSAPQN